jgi:hypothetical protein
MVQREKNLCLPCFDGSKGEGSMVDGGVGCGLRDQACDFSPYALILEFFYCRLLRGECRTFDDFGVDRRLSLHVRYDA